MSSNKYQMVLALCLGLVVFSCNYRSGQMVRTAKDYDFDAIPASISENYQILGNDWIEFQLYANDGTSLIDMTALTQSNERIGVNSVNNQYLVASDGVVKLPIIGGIELKGKTIREAQNLLQEKYAQYYVKPFVLLKVLNRRVTIFVGGSSTGKVIPLQNENITIIEGLALAGGLDKYSKADKIKLIRGDLKDPQVFLFDFSSIEGMKDAGFVLQPNDIIYVDHRINILTEWVREVSPIIGFIASTITLVLVWGNR